jgi:hypothetical protein
MKIQDAASIRCNLGCRHHVGASSAQPSARARTDPPVLSKNDPGSR